MSDDSRTNAEILDRYGEIHFNAGRNMTSPEAVWAASLAEVEGARAAVLARMSSPSHDRAMAEGGWQPIIARSVMQWLEKHLDSVCAKDGLAADDSQAHQALAWVRRALPPTPTTKEASLLPIVRCEICQMAMGSELGANDEHGMIAHEACYRGSTND